MQTRDIISFILTVGGVLSFIFGIVLLDSLLIIVGIIAVLISIFLPSIEVA